MILVVYDSYGRTWDSEKTVMKCIKTTHVLETYLSRSQTFGTLEKRKNVQALYWDVLRQNITKSTLPIVPTWLRVFYLLKRLDVTLYVSTVPSIVVLRTGEIFWWVDHHSVGCAYTDRTPPHLVASAILIGLYPCSGAIGRVKEFFH